MTGLRRWIAVCKRVPLACTLHTTHAPLSVHVSLKSYGVLRRLKLSVMTTLRSYEPAEDESVEPDVVIVINGFGCVGKTTLCLGLAGGDVHSEYLPTVSDGTLWP